MKTVPSHKIWSMLAIFFLVLAGLLFVFITKAQAQVAVANGLEIRHKKARVIFKIKEHSNPSVYLNNIHIFQDQDSLYCSYSKKRVVVDYDTFPGDSCYFKIVTDVSFPRGRGWSKELQTLFDGYIYKK